MERHPVQDRKYKAFWATLLIITVMLAWSKLSGAQFVEALTLVFGLYMAGNVGEHGADAVKSHKQKNDQPDPAIEVSVKELQSDEERGG